jgi:hypothetical protein
MAKTTPLRPIVAIVALIVLVALVALPALAADPSGSPTPAASDPSPTPEASAAPEASATLETTPTPAPTPAPTVEPAPDASAEPSLVPATTDDDGGTQVPERPPKPVKADKGKGEPVTMSGTIGTRTDADGNVEYILTSGGTVVVLDAGPAWFFGDDHPLQGRVGDRVTIVGEQRAGEAAVEVETVDGVRLREPGKPPWAGGWKAVGERHPGWSEEKAARAADRAARHAERNAAKAARHGTDCWPPGQCKDGALDEGSSATNPPGD